MKSLPLPLVRRELFCASPAKRIIHMSRSRKWRSKESAANRQQTRAVTSTSKMTSKPDYTAWSQDKLIERVTQLEIELNEKNRRSIAVIVSKYLSANISSVSPRNLPNHQRESTKNHMWNDLSTLPNTIHDSLLSNLHTWARGITALNTTQGTQPHCRLSRRNYGRH